MATGNKRDVRLAVEIDTVGEESLRRAGDELKRLAKEGGAAAPELAALAAQFDKLADQSGALATFRQLGAEVDKLKAAQTEAAAAAGVLGDRLAEAKAASEPLRKQQADLAEGVRQAEVELTKADAALKTYAAGFDRAGKQTAEFVARNAQLVDAREKAKVSLAQEEAALERVVEALKRVTPEENKLQRQYEAQQARLNDANEALRQRERALKAASEAALAAGAATTDLAASEADLLRATQETVGATRRLADEQEQAAIAARLTDAEFAKNVTTLRELDAAARALADADSAAAMQKLEQGAREADAQFDKLVASLRAAEAAAEEYAAATARAAGATRDDTQALQSRQAAAQRLLDVERALTAEQREVAAARNAGRAAILAEAQALLQQAAAARESQAASEAAVKGALRANAALESAFGATGIRSIDAIKDEINQTRVALERLEKEARQGGIGLDDLNRAAGAAEVKLARLRAEIQQVQATPTQFEALASSINNIITRFAGLGAAVATVGVAVRPVLEATIALESTNRVLTSVTGSAASAAAQVEFLRNVAQRSGQSFTELSQSYSKFAASALQVGLSINDTQKVFESVALAAGNLGLGSEQAGRALEALSQIASKGVVSMEELRGQLGDALPGVLPLLAKQLGLTTAELSSVVEAGQLMAGEAIPAIGRALQKLGTEGGAPVEGLAASFQRFKNVVLEAGTTLVDGPLGKAAGLVVGAFAGVVRDATVVVVSFSEAVGATARSVGAIVAALTGSFGSFAEFRDAVSKNFEDAGARVRAFEERAYAATTAAGAMSKAFAEAATSGVKAAGGTEEQAQSLAKLALVQAKAVAAAELLTRTTERLAQAAEAEQKAVAGTVQLVIDEGEARKRAASALDTVAVAREKVVTAAAAEVEALRASRQAVLDRIGADEQQLAGAQKLLDLQADKIKKADADLEKTKALANAARESADAAKLAAKEYGDQSGQLERLQTELDGAQQAYDAVLRAFRRGKADTDDLTRADRALVEAKHALNDALDDLEKATRRNIDSIKAESEVTKAQIELEITKLRIRQQVLIQQGRLEEAQRLDLKLQELQLAASKNGTAAKVAEAKAQQELILKQFADAEARGVLTDALRQELNTRYNQQQAIILQTEAQKLNEQQTEKNLEAVKNGTSALDGNTKSMSTNTGAAGANATAIGGVSTAMEGAAKSANVATTSMDRFYAALEKLRGFDGGVSGAGITGIRGPVGGDVFTNAGRETRNNSFRDTPFKSGSTGGGTYQTGQAVNKPTTGEWVYTLDPAKVEINGVDARGNRLPGGWMQVRGAASFLGANDLSARQAQLQAGIDPVTGRPFAGAAPISPNQPDPITTDTDTPGTLGTVRTIPVLGKFEFTFRNEVTGRITSGYTDTAEQAQAMIDNLQAAFRSANGG